MEIALCLWISVESCNLHSSGSGVLATKLLWFFVPPAIHPKSMGQHWPAELCCCVPSLGLLLGANYVYSLCLQWFCTLMLLLCPTFSWGSSSLLLFHLHSFHLVPHFWMAREVRGRRRLRGSKMPRRP